MIDAETPLRDIHRRVSSDLQVEGGLCQAPGRKFNVNKLQKC